LTTVNESEKKKKKKKKKKKISFKTFFFLLGPATGSAAENCAVHSTNNRINCNSCVRDTTNSCSWCGTASTGSCHATSGTSADFLCNLLLRGQLITAASVTANASLANQCPTGTTPNYCPTYLGCAACQADADCAFCISFDDSCFREGRCVSKSDRQAVCTNNPDLKRPHIIGPAPDLDVTCANVPTSCSDLDAIVGTSGGGTAGPTTSGGSGGTSGPAGGSTTGGGTNASGGGGGTTATLPSACDDIAILDKCVKQCVTGSNVDQCKCVDGAESITCKDMQTIAVPATSSTSSLMITFAGVALSALLAVLAQ
jgi:uncharacterized membrane protein YgcG